MENLHNYLPKDLVNIVEEYSKDRTNYDNVIIQYNEKSCESASIIINSFYQHTDLEIETSDEIIEQICSSPTLYKYFLICLTTE